MEAVPESVHLGIISAAPGRRLLGDPIASPPPVAESRAIGQVGVVWGGVDPYGPRSMNMTGRWAAASDADLIALALRCAWEEDGVAMQPHVAAELAKLESLELLREQRGRS